MAPRSATVHIPQPCPQSWAAMTPRGPGRHCAACQKTVIDFTQKTDAEILAVLKQAAGNACGRFRAEQLGRPLLPLAVQGPSRWRAWLAAAVALWGLREGIGAPTKAQSPTEQYAPGPPAVSTARTASPETHLSILVEGVVTDSISHDRLPGVIIMLKDTTIGTYTKADGTFQLQIPSLLLERGPAVLVIRYVGFATHQIKLPAAIDASVINVALTLSPAVLGEIVSVKPKLTGPWHPRRFYYWSKYWLARPFRQG